MSHNPESNKETPIIHDLCIISLPVVLVRFYYVIYDVIRVYLSVYFTHCIVVVVRVPIVLLLYLAATLATNSINTLPLHYNRGSSGKMIVKNGLCVQTCACVCVGGAIDLYDGLSVIYTRVISYNSE